MTAIRESINKLIEETLTMEEQQKQSYPLTQSQLQELLDPRLQTQPPLSEDKNEEAMEVIQESSPEKNLDFSQQPSENTPVEKSIVKRNIIKYTATRIKYSPTRVKSRNFLSNISYTGISKVDFHNESFILDIYILLVKNLNPFSLQRKISGKFKQEVVYILRRECIPSEFYRQICQDENFKYLNGRDVNQPSVLKIVGNFIDQGKENLRMLQKSLANYKDIYQYVYSHVFLIIMRQQNLAKQPVNYENAQQEKYEFEQKPIKNFDDFSDGEEEDFKIMARKQTNKDVNKKKHQKQKNLKSKKKKTKRMKARCETDWMN